MPHARADADGAVAIRLTAAEAATLQSALAHWLLDQDLATRHDEAFGALRAALDAALPDPGAGPAGHHAPPRPDADHEPQAPVHVGVRRHGPTLVLRIRTDGPAVTVEGNDGKPVRIPAPPPDGEPATVDVEVRR